MASLSRALMNDFHVMRTVYQESENYAGTGMMDLAEDHADGISKHHLPDREYLQRMLDVLESIKPMAHITPAEAEALDEAIAIVAGYQVKLEEYLASLSY